MDTKKNMRNDLFKRQEIVMEVAADKNPGFNEAKKIVSEKFSKPEENIEIRGVQGKFGKKTFAVDAHIYDSKEDLVKAVQKSKKQRVAEKNAEAEAKKAEAEAKKAEAEAKKVAAEAKKEETA